MRKPSLLVLAVVCLLGWSRPAAAQRYYTPGRFEISVEPENAQPLLGTAGLNGLQVIAPNGADTEILFGINAGFGVLATAMVEPGLNFSLLVDSPGNNVPTATIFAMVPNLKINLWVTPHVNPYFQPFAGFALRSQSGSDGFFDGGIYAGLELLPAAWGFRLYTGFEAVVGSGPGNHAFGIPARWAFVAYF